MTEASSHRAIALMREGSRLYTKLFGKRFRELKLTPEEARTLAHLSVGETMAQRSLAELMHVQPITLSRLLDRLETAGFAERRLSKKDRRAKEIHLTTRGRAAARKILAVNDGLADQLSARLGASELQALTKGLMVIREALEDMR